MSIEELHQTNKGKTLIPIHKINVYFFDFDCFVGSILHCYNTTNKTE